MSRPALAVQLYTLRRQFQTPAELRTTLKKVADIGYTAVELSCVDKFAPPDVARALADHGLRAISAHTAWERLQSQLDAVMAEFRTWDCRHVVIGGLPREYYGPGGLERFLRELPPVTTQLAAAGLDFHYHNHSHELARYGERTWLEQLFERTDARQVKAEIDTYWIQHGGGDPAAWIRRYAGRVPLVHLKDMLITPQREQRDAEVGCGNLNWPAIFAAAQEAGVEWTIVEQDECYERDPFDSIALSYAYLHALGLR